MAQGLFSSLSSKLKKRQQSERTEFIGAQGLFHSSMLYTDSQFCAGQVQLGALTILLHQTPVSASFWKKPFLLSGPWSMAQIPSRASGPWQRSTGNHENRSQLKSLLPLWNGCPGQGCPYQNASLSGISGCAFSQL